MIKWTKEKTDRIFELRQQGVSYQSIADEFQTSNKNIATVITRMRNKPEYGDILHANKWTEEDLLKLVEFRSKGFNNKEIADLLGRAHTAVKQKASELVKSGVLTPITKNFSITTHDLPVEELLDNVRKYVTRDDCPAHIVTNVKRVFGSWTEGLKAAGISGNIGGKFDPNKPTKVYFLDFGEFQKIGITQREIEYRFKGAPDYTVLDFVETDLANAIYLEKELKKVVKQFIPEHEWFARNGKTECFKSECKTLEDLFALS